MGRFSPLSNFYPSRPNGISVIDSKTGISLARILPNHFQMQSMKALPKLMLLLLLLVFGAYAMRQAEIKLAQNAHLKMNTPKSAGSVGVKTVSH